MVVLYKYFIFLCNRYMLITPRVGRLINLVTFDLVHWHVVGFFLCKKHKILNIQFYQEINIAVHSSEKEMHNNGDFTSKVPLSRFRSSLSLERSRSFGSRLTTQSRSFSRSSRPPGVRFYHRETSFWKTCIMISQVITSMI